jgi:hypothetical protein
VDALDDLRFETVANGGGNGHIIFSF